MRNGSIGTVCHPTLHALRYLSIAVLLALFCAGSARADQTSEEWLILYDNLRWELDAHQQHNLGNFMDYPPYVKKLELLAGDRDRAKGLAQKAAAEGNEFWSNRFFDLVQLAMEYTDDTLNAAHNCYPLERDYVKTYWHQMCVDAIPAGPAIYSTAVDLECNATIVREDIRENLWEALYQWENGWELLPSDFWPFPEGYPNPQADQMLEVAECIRDIAKHFELGTEHEKATEILTRYLKDAACFADNGHQWFIDLAVKHELAEARSYLEDFYAMVYGKVEVDTPEGREPADNALVIITDPHDGRTWTATANENGEYEILDAILHGNCSPFNIRAEHHGDVERERYWGPLDEPDPFHKFEKNLLISRDFWDVNITYTQIGNLGEPGSSAKRNYALTVKARVKPRRDEEQVSAFREPALGQIETLRKMLESEHYKAFLDDDARAEIENQIQELIKEADSLGGLKSYASTGAEVTISDVFDRTDQDQYTTEKWRWSGQHSGQLSLNVGLDTNAGEQIFELELGGMDPDGNDHEDASVNYIYEASRKSKLSPDANFECSGAIKVDVMPGIATLLNSVPDAKRAFGPEQKTLSGSHTWTTSSPGIADVGHRAFGDECKQGYPLAGEFKFQHSLTWTIKRVSS